MNACRKISREQLAVSTVSAYLRTYETDALKARYWASQYMWHLLCVSAYLRTYAIDALKARHWASQYMWHLLCVSAY